MKIIAFGITRDITGSLFTDIDTGDAAISIGNLKTLLIDKYPPLGRLKSFSVAVNNKYADDQMVVGNQDEVALIPPVSGG